MVEPPPPTLLVLAGPNGAGKSTFYASFLAQLTLPFLNADRLAQAAALDPYAAAREISAIRDDFIRRRQSFILETVFSDPVGEKVQIIESASQSGYDARLLFIGIEDAQLSAQRVASRVRAGGHDVPRDKIADRYSRTLENLKRAIPTVPSVVVYDNSSFRSPYRLLGEFRDGHLVRRSDDPVPLWARSVLP